MGDEGNAAGSSWLAALLSVALRRMRPSCDEQIVLRMPSALRELGEKAFRSQIGSEGDQRRFSSHRIRRPPPPINNRTNPLQLAVHAQTRERKEVETGDKNGSEG